MATASATWRRPTSTAVTFTSFAGNFKISHPDTWEAGPRASKFTLLNLERGDDAILFFAEESPMSVRVMPSPRLPWSRSLAAIYS